MLKELVMKNRSYRRFYQDKKIGSEQLRALVDIGRLTASGANKQPVRYILSNEDGKMKLFSNALDGQDIWRTGLDRRMAKSRQHTLSWWNQKV